ncbi:MAG: protein kinase, partial [Ramlibacter sp.]
MAARPDTLGHYKVQRVLGKGAMGMVYEAIDSRLHRRVAIKTIQKVGFGDWSAQEFSARFLREAQAVARLNHPNIVQVYDFGEDEQLSFIVMEFIDGEDLKTHLEHAGRFQVGDAVRISCELLDALDFAHRAGVVHRDIKPANVMLDSQRRTKLTDFGVARLTDQDHSRADSTQVGTMVGTPAYMSPEQVLGQKIDGRSDIFSAGVLLYEFLTGKKPFEGGAFTLAKMIIEADPPPPSSVERSISPELDRIITQAMAKSPDDRFATAGELAHSLRSFLSRAVLTDLDEGSTVLAPGAYVGPRDTASHRTEPPMRTGGSRGRLDSTQNNEADLEFWRSIKDSDDAEDLELYVRKFPDGIYVDLAKRKISKLRRSGSGVTDEDSGMRSGQFDEEYWRAIKDSVDPDDLELYLRKFPDGTFAELARRRLAKLRRGLSNSGNFRSDVRAGSGMPGSVPPGDGRDEASETQWRAKRRAQDEARRDVEWQAEEQARRAAEEEKARQLAAESARRQAEELAAQQLRQQAEADRREAAERARVLAEVEARRQAEAEAEARRQAEIQARAQAEAAARRKAQEEEALRLAKAQALREAEEEARRLAEAEAERRRAEELAAEELARRQAEMARKEAEARARQEAEAKVRRDAEEQARRDADERARREAEEIARREAEENARREAEARARREAEEKARREAEEKTRLEAELQARRAAAAEAAREAEIKAGQEAAAAAQRKAEEEEARRLAQAKALREAQEQARQAAERKATRQAEERAQLAAEQKALADRQAEARRAAAAATQQQADALAKRERSQAIPSGRDAKRDGNRLDMAVPVIVLITLVLGMVGAYYALRPHPGDSQLASPPLKEGRSAPGVNAGAPQAPKAAGEAVRAPPAAEKPEATVAPAPTALPEPRRQVQQEVRKDKLAREPEKPRRDQARELARDNAADQARRDAQAAEAGRAQAVRAELEQRQRAESEQRQRAE